MKKLLALAAVLGLLFVGSVSNAQSWVFHIGPSLTGTPPSPVEGASGTYHVVISAVAGSPNAFDVSVSGHDDGNYQDAALGTMSPPPDPPVAKSGIGRISLNFYRNDNGGLDAGTGVSGASTAYAGNGPGIGVSNNVGGPRNLAMGSGGGAWDIVDNGGATVVFSTPFIERYVAPHGGNQFLGRLTLLTGDWARVGISLQDSGQQWSGEFFRQQFVPESSSLALLLPGLVPLALVIRRKRRA